VALYIFSDAHLGAHSPEIESLKKKKIAELCELVKNDGDRLIILGDLFDFWFEYKYTAPKEHYDILFMLSEVKKSGIAIDYVSGNHDFWMDDFFENQLGIRLHRDELNTQYEGKKIHLLHGDGLSPQDGGYRILKRIFRNKFNIWLYRKLPPDWAFSLARKASGQSRALTSQRDSKFVEDYRIYAKEKINSGFDIVVLAHLHLPILESFGNQTYINTGDFIIHFSYVKMSNGLARLESLK
jgi:UDP-2,3-diacylglucosamine hydrolase